MARVFLDKEERDLLAHGSDMAKRQHARVCQELSAVMAKNAYHFWQDAKTRELGLFTQTASDEYARKARVFAGVEAW